MKLITTDRTKNKAAIVDISIIECIVPLWREDYLLQFWGDGRCVQWEYATKTARDKDYGRLIDLLNVQFI